MAVGVAVGTEAGKAVVVEADVAVGTEVGLAVRSEVGVGVGAGTEACSSRDKGRAGESMWACERQAEGSVACVHSVSVSISIRHMYVTTST